MAVLRAAFRGAWEVCALRAAVAFFFVLAEAGAIARPTLVALPAMLADARATARRAYRAPLAVNTDTDAAARRAMGALLAVGADAGTTARRALVALPAVLALLPHVPFDYMWRWRGRQCCRRCWRCLHGAMVASTWECASFYLSCDRPAAPLNAHVHRGLKAAIVPPVLAPNPRKWCRIVRKSSTRHTCLAFRGKRRRNSKWATSTRRIVRIPSRRRLPS